MNHVATAVIMTLTLAAALAGCQGQQTLDPWATAALADRTEAEVFEAARSVLAEDYTIARADGAAGVIETRPMVIHKRGDDRAAGAYLSSGDVQVFRRTVVARVEGGQASSVVRLVARLERESTSQAETLLLTTGEDDRRDAGAERRWAQLDRSQATYWAGIGRDHDAEQGLLQRIRRRLATPGDATE